MDYLALPPALHQHPAAFRAPAAQPTDLGLCSPGSSACCAVDGHGLASSSGEPLPSATTRHFLYKLAGIPAAIRSCRRCMDCSVISPGPYIGSCCRGITVPRFALPPLGAEVGGDARNACFIVCLQPDAQGHAWDLRLRTGNGVALHANTQPDDPDCLSCPRCGLGLYDSRRTASEHLAEPL